MHHDHLHAVLVIEMHVQRGAHLVAELVLERIQPFGQIADVMIVDERERRHGAHRAANFGPHHGGPRQIAQRLGASAAAFRDQLLTEGKAASVKLEEVVTATVRARAPEIAAAKTLDEKLQALWRARKLDLEPPRVDRLLTKTHELEGEAAA